MPRKPLILPEVPGRSISSTDLDDKVSNNVPVLLAEQKKDVDDLDEENVDSVSSLQDLTL